MLAILSRTVDLYHGYQDLMDNKSDPRVKDWPLMSSPFPTLFICLFFAYFAKVLGPKLMRNRPPFQMRKILIVYNALQVCLSAYIFYEVCMAGWLTGYSFRCQAVDYSRSPKAMRMASTVWLYHMSKYTEFFDTLFFILRKRYDQVSTLHVIHHGIMPISTWPGVKFAAGGHLSFAGMLNTFVHIVMYTYYALAAVGPQMQPYLWWKKYLTSLQIIQFIVVLLHSAQLIFKNDCNFPIVFVYVIGGHAVMFYMLFSHFYKVTYTNKSKQSSSKPEKVKCDNNRKAKSNYNITKVQKWANTNIIPCMNTEFYETMEPVENIYSTTHHRVFKGTASTRGNLAN